MNSALSPETPDFLSFMERNRHRLLLLAEAMVSRCRQLLDLVRESENAEVIQKAVLMLQDAELQQKRTESWPPTGDLDHWFLSRPTALLLKNSYLKVKQGQRPDVAPVLQRVAELVHEYSVEVEKLHEEYASNGYPGESDQTTIADEPLRQLSDHAADLTGRILLVDDDPEICQELAQQLQLQGHHADACCCSREAQELLAEPGYDLILLDVVMPGMNGLQLLRWVRKQRHLDSVAVLMVSSLGEVRSTIRCIVEGAEDYLHKPIHVELLQAKIRSFLQRRQSQLRFLEQFFPSAVARQVLNRPESVEEGKIETVTVLFCDVRGFSRICGQLKDPARIIRWVSAVLELLTECVVERQGVIVDFQGDSLMATWGAPGPQADHARLACQAALDMFERLEEWNRAESPDRPPEPTLISVGIHTGTAWVGNTGNRRRMKYGPLGDTVNKASRIQGATKYLKAYLIISDATWKCIKGLRVPGSRAPLFPTRRLALISAVNIDEPLRVHEIDCARTPNWNLQKRYYERALALFEKKKLPEASKVLSKLLLQESASEAVLAMLARILNALTDREQWSRVYHLPAK